MSDIVERLRFRADENYEMLGNIHEPLLEAADEITRLRAENEKLRAALGRAAHELELLYFFAISNGIAEAGIPPHVQARAAITQEKRDE